MARPTATNTRRKFEKEERRLEAVRLYYEEKYTLKMIAQELSISQTTAGRYLDQTREIWSQRANITLNEHVYTELAKLEKQETNVLKWLEFFKIDLEDEEQTKRNSPEARKWVEIWIKLASRKASLLGLDKVKKFEADTGQPVIIKLIPIDGGTDDREPEIIEGTFTEVTEDEEEDEGAEW
jgi:transposase-like protein